MTTDATEDTQGIWSCSNGELEQAIQDHAKEFDIQTWTKEEVDHFLELRFHLVRGSVTKQHLDEVLRIVTHGQLKEFDDGNPAGLEKKDPVSEITYKLGTYLLVQKRFYAESKNGRFWMYDARTGIWKENALEYISHFVADYMGKAFKTHQQNEVIGYLKSLSYPLGPPPILGGPPEKIVLKNGVLNVETGEVTPFNPDEYHVAAIPVTYDPNAHCPEFEKFHEEILPLERDRLTVLEHLGSCLHKQPYENILILLGDGANGKSVLLKVITAFLGVESLAFLTIQQLEERFLKAKLFGKLANIGDDIPFDALKQTGWIKQLTGGVPIEGEFKNVDAFSFCNYAKPWFSANRLPATPDETNAFHRRVQLIDFTQVFAADDPKTIPMEVLVKKITTEQELSGLLNLAVEGLHRLRNQGHLTGRKSVAESRMEYIRKSDSIQYFVRKYVEHDVHADPIPKARMYEVYMKVCHSIGAVPVSDGWFGKKIRRIIPYIDEVQPREDGERLRAWVGVAVRTDIMRDDGIDVDGTTFTGRRKDAGQVQEALRADAPKVQSSSCSADFTLSDSREIRWTDFLARAKKCGKEELTLKVMDGLYTRRERSVIDRDLSEWEKQGRICWTIDSQDNQHSHWKIMEGEFG